MKIVGSAMHQDNPVAQWPTDERWSIIDPSSIPHGTFLKSFYGFPSFLFDMTDGGALSFARCLHSWRCTQGRGGLLSAALWA